MVVALAVELSGSQPAPRVDWRDAPAYRALFTRPDGDAYRIATSPSDLPAVLAALVSDPTLVRSPGAWTARSQHPLDAFGRTGPYNRWALARLYGSRQARVARGARMMDGRPVESWTLISPYPDPRLERLEPGTLLIVLRLP